jgi:hypothetical protein
VGESFFPVLPLPLPVAQDKDPLRKLFIEGFHDASSFLAISLLGTNEG